MPANWLALHNNINQELNGNSISTANYFTSNQLQPVITTYSNPDGFTLIVCNSQKTYSQPTVTLHSHNSKTPTTTSPQQLTPKKHDPPTPYNT